jgi:hypothetical protein
MNEEEHYQYIKAVVEDAVYAALDKRRRTLDTEEVEDHRFVRELRVKRAGHDKLIEDTKKQVLGWATIGVLGFIGYALLDSFKDWLLRIIH